METGRSVDHWGRRNIGIGSIFNPVPVKICIFPDSYGSPPKQGTEDSAGYDLFAAESMTIPPHETVCIPLGFSTEIHPDYHCRIESRSGMASRGHAVVTGVIDADYRGEWKVILHNLTDEPLAILSGDKVAQAVFRPTVRIAFQPVSKLSESTRGAGGFGSTGR